MIFLITMLFSIIVGATFAIVSARIENKKKVKEFKNICIPEKWYDDF